jgi:hypothetical protein
VKAKSVKGNNINGTKKNGTPGNDFVSFFVNRHLRISSRKDNDLVSG